MGAGEVGEEEEARGGVWCQYACPPNFKTENQPGSVCPDNGMVAVIIFMVRQFEGT